MLVLCESNRFLFYSPTVLVNINLMNMNLDIVNREGLVESCWVHSPFSELSNFYCTNHKTVRTPIKIVQASIL